MPTIFPGTIRLIFASRFLFPVLPEVAAELQTAGVRLLVALLATRFPGSGANLPGPTSPLPLVPRFWYSTQRTLPTRRERPDSRGMVVSGTEHAEREMEEKRRPLAEPLPPPRPTAHYLPLPGRLNPDFACPALLLAT
jgi:hypothetical protein